MLPILVMGIHLLAAMAWTGGMIFSLVVLNPILKRFASASLGDKVLIRIDDRLKTVRWLSFITLLLTGFFNLLYEGGSERLESDWGAVLMIKLLFVVIVGGLTGVNDFILHARVVTLRTESSSNVFFLNHSILIFALIIILISIYLGFA